MNTSRWKWLILVGWFWVVVGVGKVLCSLWALFSGPDQNEALSIAVTLAGPDSPWPWRLFFSVSRHTIALGLLDMSLGILVAGTAICFLRGYAWSRVSLEAICWCAVVVTIANLAFWQAMLRTFANVQDPAASQFSAFVVRETYLGGIRLVVLGLSAWF